MSDALKTALPRDLSWLHLIWLVASATAFVGGTLGIQALQVRHPEVSPLVFQAIMGLQAAGFVLVLWGQVSARSHAFEFALLAILVSFSGAQAVIPEILALYVLDAVFDIRNGKAKSNISILYQNVMRLSFIFFFAQTTVAIALVAAGNHGSWRAFRPDPGLIGQLVYRLLAHILPVIYVGGLLLLTVLAVQYLIGGRSAPQPTRSTTGA